MPEAGKSGKKPKESAANSAAEPTQEEQKYILATGLEDYGRWKAMFKDRKPDKTSFRRGRIWA